MILIKKDSKGKVRCVNIWSEFTKPTYTIYRRTFQFGGKITEQPDLVISAGKAKRTLLQQCDLELNSRIKGYKDKGYKEYAELTKIAFEDISVEQITNLVEDEVTDQQGALKPMLAKDYNKCSTNALEIDWLASRKIDGENRMPSLNLINSVNSVMGIPSEIIW